MVKRRDEPGPPELGDAWQLVSLVMEWIKQADLKATAVLAGAGGLGGLLYTLVTKVERPGPAFLIACSACALAVLATATVASAALRPRRSGRGSPGPLFFGSIATGCAESVPALMADRKVLLDAMATMIWNNATIATRKYRAVGVAVSCLQASAATLAVAAALSRTG